MVDGGVNEDPGGNKRRFQRRDNPGHLARGEYNAFQWDLLCYAGCVVSRMHNEAGAWIQAGQPVQRRL